MDGKTLLNRYKLLEEIHKTDLNQIYKAVDLTQTDKFVLINLFHEKIKHRPLENLLRFKKQMELLSTIQHEHLLKIYAYYETEENSMLIMEYFEAKPLSLFLNKNFSIDESIDLILQIASCLNTCHQQGFLHQTLQPDNILFNEDKKSIKLFNFGLHLLIDLSGITKEKEIIST
ncbi:MAG: protein kinase, partial [bacterium]|nr:protein kinase [bacterium]